MKVKLNWTEDFIVQYGDEWVVYDETQANIIGKFNTRDEAVTELAKYAEWLEGTGYKRRKR